MKANQFFVMHSLEDGKFTIFFFENIIMGNFLV